MQDVAVQAMPVPQLRPYTSNARTHSKKQIRQIADSIRRFGFTNPVLISDDNQIIAGHGRVEAAKVLGMASVPTLRLSHLDAAPRRAYVLADNKLALNAGWDREVLAIELQALIDLEMDIEITGFSLAEADLILEEARASAPDAKADADDQTPPLTEPGAAVSRAGDLWFLGRHRLLCGDSRNAASFEALLQGESADLVFTDPPYNVPIDGHVCGLGRIRHREFAMGAGEMSKEAFTDFLRTTLGHAAARCRDGAIAFVCMDWRHMGELLEAGRSVFTELKNLCVWNKTNGGMGTFYRSKHELVFVFKVGSAPHTNTFGLGDTGRYRTNVWDHPGVNTLRPSRTEELAMHPTVKPVALVAEAIKDCSRRGEIVLDPFGGSGSTLIAAERTGRLARVIEFDPAYCDQILHRFEAVTGKPVKLANTGQSFEALAEETRSARNLLHCGGRAVNAAASKHKAQAQQYEVGYRKPPVDTRFRKGRSGNPGGRPRGMTPGRLANLTLKEAYRLISVRDGERVFAIPTIQAVLRNQLALAAKGNGSAQRAVIAEIQAIERELAVTSTLAPRPNADLPERSNRDIAKALLRIFNDA